MPPRAPPESAAALTTAATFAAACGAVLGHTKAFLSWDWPRRSRAEWRARRHRVGISGFQSPHRGLGSELWPSGQAGPASGLAEGSFVDPPSAFLGLALLLSPAPSAASRHPAPKIGSQQREGLSPNWVLAHSAAALMPAASAASTTIRTPSKEVSDSEKGCRKEV